MSFSHRCRHCGFNETCHEEPSVAEEHLWNEEMGWQDILPGYTLSLSQCEGYESEDPEAEAAAIAFAEAEARWKGKVERQQGVIMMLYSPGSSIPPRFVNTGYES